MKGWKALIFPCALILVGAVPVIYLAVLLALQLATTIQIGSWVALPLRMLFTEPALLETTKAAPLLGLVPDLSWAWRVGPDTAPPLAWLLGNVHFAALPALAGLLIAASGALRLRRHAAAMHTCRQQREDRERRAQDYRQNAPADALGRREPFIA
jgi:hypothetical protein